MQGIEGTYASIFLFILCASRTCSAYDITFHNSLNARSANIAFNKHGGSRQRESRYLVGFESKPDSEEYNSEKKKINYQVDANSLVVAVDVHKGDIPNNRLVKSIKKSTMSSIDTRKGKKSAKDIFVKASKSKKKSKKKSLKSKKKSSKNAGLPTTTPLQTIINNQSNIPSLTPAKTILPPQPIIVSSLSPMSIIINTTLTVIPTLSLSKSGKSKKSKKLTKSKSKKSSKKKKSKKSSKYSYYPTLSPIPTISLTSMFPTISIEPSYSYNYDSKSKKKDSNSRKKSNKSNKSKKKSKSTKSSKFLSSVAPLAVVINTTIPSPIPVTLPKSPPGYITATPPVPILSTKVPTGVTTLPYNSNTYSTRPVFVPSPKVTPLPTPAPSIIPTTNMIKASEETSTPTQTNMNVMNQEGKVTEYKLKSQLPSSSPSLTLTTSSSPTSSLPSPYPSSLILGSDETLWPSVSPDSPFPSLSTQTTTLMPSDATITFNTTSFPPSSSNNSKLLYFNLLPFSITFQIQDNSTAKLYSNDIQNITVSYLNYYLKFVLNSSAIEIITDFIMSTSNNSIVFDLSATLEPNSTLILIREDLEMLIDIAFQQPVVETFLSELRELPSINPFSTTTNITYQQVKTNSETERSSTIDTSDNMSSTASTVGAIAGIVGAIVLTFIVSIIVSMKFYKKYPSKSMWSHKKVHLKSNVEYHDRDFRLIDTNSDTSSSVESPSILSFGHNNRFIYDCRSSVVSNDDESDDDEDVMAITFQDKDNHASTRQQDPLMPSNENDYKSSSLFESPFTSSSDDDDNDNKNDKDPLFNQP